MISSVPTQVLCTYLSPKIFQGFQSDDCLDTGYTKSVFKGESFWCIHIGFADKLLPYLLLDMLADWCRRSECRV